jgi:CubicO group peptidase (beta-lactamase class C family)
LEKYAFGNNQLMILSSGNTIIAEKSRLYKNISPAGNSMSKSVLSLLLGKALFDGSVSSLDDKAERYSRELKGTNWGQTSIKDLLRMSSGSFSAPKSFFGHKNKQMQKELSGSISGKTTRSLVSILKTYDDKKFTSGKKFIYSNADTIALGLVLKNATKKPIYALTQDLWNDVGANYEANWLVNSSDETVTYMGFSASPNDWILLGHFVIRSLKANDCFSEYMKKATSSQIDNPDFYETRDYGYQIWTNCDIGSGAFCVVGAFGQLLMIEPKKELVLYVHSTNRKSGGVVHWGLYLWEAYKGVYIYGRRTKNKVTT